MDCSKYKDSGTAHRCHGCGASIHRKIIQERWGTYKQFVDNFFGELVCDRTGEAINICGVTWP